MKIYIVSAEIDVSEDGTAFKPFNRAVVSQAEAASARAELVQLGVKRKDIKTHEVDVPTTKSELVPFLNLLMHGKYVADGVTAVAFDYKLKTA